MIPFSTFLPDDLAPIGLTLALSFLIGLEREERRDDSSTHYVFGGIRTFPLIGLSGYMIARLAGDQPIVIAFGFATLGALLWLSYRKKLELSTECGMTSEISGLFTFLLGALVYQRTYWVATALAVVALLLLEFKKALENMARRIPAGEILTFTRFLLLSAVILPIVPSEELTQFHIDPHKTWLIVVAISGLSYLAYLIGKLLGARRGVLVSAVLGGLYSSTLATVILAKRSKGDDQPRLYTGAMLIASGLMYLRILVLLALFNGDLARQILLPFTLLGAVGVFGGFVWSRTRPRVFQKGREHSDTRNPLEIQAAALFSGFFVLMTILTQVVERKLGSTGIYGLSFISGLSDVDPFIMSLSQTAGHSMAMGVSASAVVIATSSNNLIKGFYAYLAGEGQTKRQSACALGLFSLLGFAALGLV